MFFYLHFFPFTLPLGIKCYHRVFWLMRDEDDLVLNLFRHNNFPSKTNIHGEFDKHGKFRMEFLVTPKSGGKELIIYLFRGEVSLINPSYEPACMKFIHVQHSPFCG